MEEKKSAKTQAQEEFSKAESFFHAGDYKSATEILLSLAQRKDLPGKLPHKAAEYAKRMKPDPVYYYVAAGTTFFLCILYLAFH